jgi:hypothetical protein
VIAKIDLVQGETLASWTDSKVWFGLPFPSELNLVGWTYCCR